MSLPHLPSKAESDEEKRRVEATYRRVAVGYDKQRFTRVCAHRLVELLDLGGGENVLDVATGTGWAAMAAGRVVGFAGRVVGVDMAKNMLEQARRKIEAAHLTNVEVREGDAEHLDFVDSQFDAVSCASAIFFLPHMLEALLEWRRVTRTGGRVAFSTFGDTFFEPLRSLLHARLRSYGVLVPTQVPSQRLVDPSKCRDLMRDAGFTDVEVRAEQLGYHVSDADEYWDDSVAWNGATQRYVSQIPSGQLDQFKAEHLAEVAALTTDRGIWVEVPCNFTLGRKR